MLDPENPWPGLESFREADASFFHGREPDIEALLQLIRRERLTVLYGLSGLGKSSLLQAGVFPRLRSAHVLPVAIRLDHAEQAPPLAWQVMARLSAEAVASGIEAPPPAPGETLWEHLHRQKNAYWGPGNRPVLPLLAFDPFEEIFTRGHATPAASARTDAFLEELADLIEGRAPAELKTRTDAKLVDSRQYRFDRHPYKVLLAIREDFLADLEELRKRMIPSLGTNRMRLLPLGGDEALRVTAPAGGRLVAPGVGERIVRLVAGAAQDGGSAPISGLVVDPALLSLFCREVNERRKALGRDTITADLVEGSRDEILDQFYLRSIQDLHPAVRLFVEDHLVDAGGVRNSDALANALEQPGITPEAVNALVERRLIRRDDHRHGQSVRIELTHDVLAGPVKKSREARRVREALGNARLARRQARRAYALTAVMAALALGVFALLLQVRAERARARSLAAIADFRQAVRLAEASENATALTWAAAAMRLDPGLAGARSLAFRLLAAEPFPRWSAAHGGEVYSAAFSPDGRLVASASADHTARFRDVHTGTEVGAPLQHTDEVNCIRFSPDGRRVVTASDDGTARIWDVQTRRPLGVVLRHRGRVYCAAFSPDGQRVVTASADSTARVWDGASGRPLGPPLRHGGEVNSAAFSPDGATVVTAADDSAGRIWDVRTGKMVGPRLRHGDWVSHAEFSPDGRRIVTASGDHTARVWDARTGAPEGPALLHGTWVLSATFSPDGRRVATASEDGVVRLWDARNGAALGAALGAPLRHGRDVHEVAFSPDGKTVATASADGLIRLWSVAGGEPGGPSMRHPGVVYSAVFSRDGERILTASSDGNARLWSARTLEPLGAAFPHPGLNVAVFSSDGQKVLTAGGNTVRIWSVSARRPVGSPFVQRKEIYSAMFSADGRWLVTASADSTVRIWDVRSGQAVGRPLLHRDEVNWAAFSPDGRRVVTASDDHTVRLWDVGTGRQVDSLQHTDQVRTAVFSADGRYVVSAAADRTARLWDARTGELVGAPLSHRDWVFSAAFSPDGQRVVTASRDGTARIWDARTGEPIGPPLRHAEEVDFAAFSPDGQWVVTASADHTARLWDTRTGEDGDVSDLADLAETVSGLRVREDGTVVPLPAARSRLEQLRRRFLAEPPGRPGSLLEFVQWLFADPTTRALLPGLAPRASAPGAR